MPEGWQGPDDPRSPETHRRFPIDPAAEKFEPTTGADVDSDETLSTERKSASTQNREPRSDPFSTEVKGPSSASGSGSRSGAGSAGSIVERGVVEVEVGKLVFGKYRVLERLSEGISPVWLVKDVELDVKRALKMIAPDQAFDSTSRARFRRQAQAMARISHPNVVAVHDFRLDQRDFAYVVMEYVAGQTLEKTLRPGQPMPLDWTLRVLTQLCEALQEAHDRGIIHRNLKPSNLILVPTSSGREQLKVHGFGIAKFLRIEGSPLDVETILGGVGDVGSPPYTSPEQAGGRAEPASDLYSVGVLLYEILTGQRPFQGHPAELIAQTMLKAPPRFKQVNPKAKIPPKVERVVIRCLSKQPEDRPQSALALLEEFKAALPENLTTLAQTEIIPKPTRPGRTPGPPRRRLLIAGSVVLMAILMAIALGFAARKLARREPIAAPTVPTRSSPESKPIAARLVRQGRAFKLWNGRVYLPEGYDAADPSDLDEAGYPKSLVRLDGVKFIRIPGGQFLMGGRGEDDAESTNRPAHPVVVPGFYIQKYEVANGELLAFFKKYQDRLNNDTDPESWRIWYEQVRASLSPELAGKHPARQVSWRLAADFARQSGGWLPSEAQWEYAARSGETARVLVWDPEKDRELPRENQANLFREPKNGVWTTEVGVFSNDQTRQGVMDMAGNVREWCRDPWIVYDAMSRDGPPRLPDDPPSNTLVVVRGGSFRLDFDYRFVTRRSKPIQLSEEPPEDVGFRLVIECPEVRPGP